MPVSPKFFCSRSLHLLPSQYLRFVLNDANGPSEQAVLAGIWAAAWRLLADRVPVSLQCPYRPFCR
jgi:hypothetical protein